MLTERRFSEALRKWVAKQSHEPCTWEVRVHADPMVAGTYAARVNLNDEQFDIIFTGHEFARHLFRLERELGRCLTDDEFEMEFEGHIEEVEFDEWPPRSSEEAAARSIFGI